jgi:hypothetical protein
MTSTADQEERLTKQVHNLRDSLEELVTACKTTDELRAAVGVVSQANTYLSRALAVAISSFAHGGVQPRQGEAYRVSIQAEQDLERVQEVEMLKLGEGMSLHLRQLLHLQSAASFAAAEAYGAILKAGSESLEAMAKGAGE